MLINFSYIIFKISFIILFSTNNLFAEKQFPQIRTLSITGNDNVSANELLFLLRQKPPNIFFKKPKFEPRLVKLDALTIKNYYHSQGFLDAKVYDTFETKLGQTDIKFEINEGKQYFLSDIQIKGNQIIPTRKIIELLGLETGKPYNPVRVNNNIYKIENLYHNQAKLFFKITINDQINDSVRVNIILDEGENVYVNDLFLEKNGKIDSTLIQREILFKKGDVYSKSIIDKTSKRLREMGVFSSVNIIPVRVSDSDSLVNIVIEFRKYKQREWNSSGGYDPISFAEGAPELPAISGTIEWRNRSFFNTPKQFSTKLLAGIPVNANYLTPRIRYDTSLSGNWFLGIRFPTMITGYYERFILYNTNKYEGDINRFGADMSQRIEFQQRSFVEIRAVWESFSDKTAKKVEEKSISLKMNIDMRDNPLYTKKGYSLKFISKLAGFGGEREYQKIDLSTQLYHPINNKSVFAIRIQNGKIWGWDDNKNTDYSYEKFYLGGSTSMRAWDVLMFKENEGNPSGSLIRFMTNIEIRMSLYKNFGLTIFTDSGLLENSYDKINMDNLKWDAGAGITIKTPLGPARLDYAFQIDDKSAGKIQLGVQSLF